MGDLGKFFQKTFMEPLSLPVNREPPAPPPVIILPPAADSSTQLKPDADADANSAAAATKKKQKGFQGMSEDKKTGPQGLGAVGQQNLERKLLLGY